MENREVESFWDVRTADIQRPRRPNQNQALGPIPQSQPQQQQQRKEDADSILMKSSLRVDAEEWFPSSYSPVIPLSSSHSAQNRLRSIRESSAPLEGTYDSSEEQIDTSRLKEIIKSLTYDPGQFDNVVDTFMAVLNPFLDDLDAVSNAADMIFDQALCEPSFRYNAARLCTVIDEHCPLFRSRLHTLCEKELQLNRNKQGLTLFLAELYMQLHYENIYGRSLLTSLKNLIALKKLDDVKCICHTLKLAGGSLEQYNKQTLDGIFSELEGIRLSESMLPLHGLLDSVFELRRSQWGQIALMTPTNSCLSEQNGYFSSSDDGITLYGPDGQEITTEEREFLRENFEDPNDYLGEESSDPDELYDPEPEMDEEIQAAFREFVKMSKR